MIGIGALAFAAWRLYSHRTPDGAIVVSGTIVEELSKKSSQTGRRRLLYAPRVVFQHPRTGKDEVYEPTGFGGSRFTVGERTDVIYDPATERVFRPLDQPVRETTVLVLVGLGLIAAQYFGG